MPTTNQYSFSAASRLAVDAPPISLLALVDGEEYVVLPNATSLVPVRMKDLNPAKSHSIRVIAPMTDNNGEGLIQLDGIWLDKGGMLQPVIGSLAENDVDEEDDPDEESDAIGSSNRFGLGRLADGRARRTADAQSGAVLEYKQRRRLVEIVTDTPSHLGLRRAGTRASKSDSLLAGVMGWEYLLGEMFSVDHVAISAEDMCLTHDCLGGRGEPSSMGDVFFRR